MAIASSVTRSDLLLALVVYGNGIPEQDQAHVEGPSWLMAGWVKEEEEGKRG